MHGCVDVPSRLSAALAPLVDAGQLVQDIGEPLARSAPVAFETALRLCDRGSHDCHAYHAVWQYLRHSGVWHAIRNDGPLFVAAAEQLAREGRLKSVLVSGAADYSMLAHLAHGARRGGAEPAIDVLDQCATSLHMNQWYAADRNLAIRTFESAALSFRPDRQYDLICTHTFVSWQPFAERPQLFRKWGEWLRPGGRLCFSDRVSPQETPYDPVARRKRVDALIARAVAGLAAMGTGLPCSDAEFAELVHAFSARFERAQPAMPLETVMSWAAEAGLEPALAAPVAELLPDAKLTSLMSESRPDRVRMWFQFGRP